MAKRVCSWCGRERKGKHFSTGSAECNDCVNQQANQTLAGTPAGGNNNMSLSSQLAGLFGPGGPQAIGVGPGQGGQISFGAGGGFQPSAPTGPVPLSEKSEKTQERIRVKIEKLQDAVRGGFADKDEVEAWIAAVEAGEKAKVPVIRHLTMSDANEIERLELQLKYGMNENGKPLTTNERAEIEQQMNKRMFQPQAPIAEDEEAAAIASILGGGVT